MRHLNLIGAALLASVSLVATVACDSRGVTAMKTRTFTPDERAAEKLRREGLNQRRPTPDVPRVTTPDAAKGGDTTKGGDESVPDAAAGAARNKMFNETRDGFNVAKSKVLETAKEQLGRINPDAGDILKGLTITEVGAPGKPRLEVNAILLPDDRALHLFAQFDVDAVDKDVINGKSDVKLSDLSAVPEENTSRIILATVCAEADKNVCKKVILIFSVNYGEASKDALVEVTLGGAGVVPNTALLTNVGALKPFADAQIEFGSKMESKAEPRAKDQATVKPVVPRPAAPFKDEAKSMSFKDYAAKYAEWKKQQPNADQWPKHPRPVAKTYAPQAAPAKAEPVKTEPVKTEPAKTEPVKAAPAKAAPVTNEPTKPAPTKPMTEAQLEIQRKAISDASPVPLPTLAEERAMLARQAKVAEAAQKAEENKKKDGYASLHWHQKLFTSRFWWGEGKPSLGAR